MSSLARGAREHRTVRGKESGGRALWGLPLAGLALALTLVAAGCGASAETAGTSAMAMVGPGVINDPSNKSLRFDILKFGLDRFCEEMMRRGVALKTQDDAVVSGRFFADSCQSQSLSDWDRKSIVVQFQGLGYTWTNLSGRLGFKATGLVEYAPDFQLHNGAMYIYFRPQRVDAVSFETLLVESSLAQAGMSLTGFDPNRAGNDVINAQLRRGFTVIRLDGSGAMDFGMGYVPKGRQPFKPFTVDAQRPSLTNDRTVLHVGQQDLIGGLVVEEDQAELQLNLLMEGTPAIDVMLIPKSFGDVWLRSLATVPGPSQPTAQPLLSEVVTAGQLWQRRVPVTKGVYYLVLDHSGLPPTMPPSAGQDLAARVDYAVQVVSRD
jgi:hypothetical protein